MERAARHLKENREVDLTEIASLRVFACFALRMGLAVVISPLCILAIRFEVMQGERAAGETRRIILRPEMQSGAWQGGQWPACVLTGSRWV